MDIFVLDTNFNVVKIIDTYKSLIWTTRYDEYGDFELYTQMSSEILEYIKTDYYLWKPDDDSVMVVEKILIQSNIEEGNTLTISGRSLESIIDRRIIWGRTSVDGTLQDSVKQLLDECIINPYMDYRRIDNFIFEYSDDPAITGLTLKAQYTGDNLYDVIHTICNERGIGFKITLNDNLQFVFKLYAGVDRSYNQVHNSYVIFSPNYDNLLNSNYIESKTNLKTCTLIGGEGEGSDRVFTSIGAESTGLSRRELFTDARDLSSDLGDGDTLSYEAYLDILAHRGKEKLTEHTEVSSFEGEADTTTMFRYGEDFFTGDIVQIVNEYGHEATVRITEFIVSENEEGLSMYPTFKNLLEGE